MLGKGKKYMDHTTFNQYSLKASHPLFFAIVHKAQNLYELRIRLLETANELEVNAAQDAYNKDAGALARIRDCAKVLRSILKRRSDKLAGFSVVQAIHDIAFDASRPDLTPAFYAELDYMLQGLQGRGPRKALDDIHLFSIDHLQGKEAAVERSRQLDSLRLEVDTRVARFPSGLNEETIQRRSRRRETILKALSSSMKDWRNWRWHIKHIVRDLDQLNRLVKLTADEKKAIKAACRHNLPFGITPYYLSLMDDKPNVLDASIRAQVIPPMTYVKNVSRTKNTSELDFMGEEDTSPFDLITRRYPAILILKPYNACPQICVYCQRNWEIDTAMASGAFAGKARIEQAINWIREHEAIHEVLITGGDPLAMGNNALKNILEQLAAIPTVERIRIGTRTPVTIPMRITSRVANMIASFREPGRRELAVITHVQHPYEITPDVVKAVDRFRTRGIPVYNQLVYTHFISRRFEASALRRTLRLIGIDPYYTFNTKGKDETASYRVPIARLLQEQQEEARLLPGLERTDEAVFNVPRQGKNYLRSRDHRDLISILPNGVRVYEFHPWERNISLSTSSYIYNDIPILDYLNRLAKIGENVSDYETIWYYY